MRFWAIARTSPSWTRSLTPSAWLRVVQRVRPDGVTRRAHRRQDVGQVQLALRVVGAQAAERVEQRAPVEREDRAVDLADRELLLRRIARRLRLDDALDVAVVVAHDAAVAARVVERHRRHRGGGAVLGVRPHELRERGGRDERHVARQDEHRAGRVDLARRPPVRAPPVPLGCGWTTRVTPSGRLPSSVLAGESTTTTRSAPASSAAAIGQPTSGRPQSGCSIFGIWERMRVPWPAARMTAVRDGMG